MQFVFLKWIHITSGPKAFEGSIDIMWTKILKKVMIIYSQKIHFCEFFTINVNLTFKCPWPWRYRGQLTLCSWLATILRIFDFRHQFAHDFEHSLLYLPWWVNILFLHYWLSIFLCDFISNTLIKILRRLYCRDFDFAIFSCTGRYAQTSPDFAFLSQAEALGRESLLTQIMHKIYRLLHQMK